MMLCCLAALFYSTKSTAQVKDDDFNILFAFEVHTIDDFFERFNFKDNTAFQNYVSKNYPGNNLTRSQLIHNLFNSKNLAVKKDEINSFLTSVTDTAFPEFVNYRDTDWYAELHCKVLYRNKPKKLTLILKVEQSPQKFFRWSVVSAKADFLRINQTKDSLNYLQQPPYIKPDSTFSKKYFLSPVSHALDFMDVDNVFLKKSHVDDYIYNGPQSPALQKLIDQIKNSEIDFVEVISVKYHLLKIHSWIIVVEYFLRNEKNSGWLINKLFPATREQKEKYLITALNLPAMPTY
ncbi:MAG: hypothetical protein ABIT08_12600 [Bacteroidia bacterium]